MLAAMNPVSQKLLKITDTTAKKLEKLGLNTPWEVVLHLPIRYEDETHITPIADASFGESCQVEGVVELQEVQFKPRRQLVVRIRDAAGSVLFLRFIHFYASHQKQMAEGRRIRGVTGPLSWCLHAPRQRYFSLLLPGHAAFFCGYMLPRVFCQ